MYLVLIDFAFYVSDLMNSDVARTSVRLHCNLVLFLSTCVHLLCSRAALSRRVRCARLAHVRVCVCVLVAGPRALRATDPVHVRELVVDPRV